MAKGSCDNSPAFQGWVKTAFAKQVPEGRKNLGNLLFKQNPFDPRLRTHKIHRLSAHYDRTIYAVEIEADFRVIFFIDGDCVVTVDIGTHEIYKR